MQRCETWIRLTSSSSAISTISVAALLANTDNLAVNILSVVDVDVAGAATAVRNLGRHCQRLRRSGGVVGLSLWMLCAMERLESQVVANGFVEYTERSCLGLLTGKKRWQKGCVSR